MKKTIRQLREDPGESEFQLADARFMRCEGHQWDRQTCDPSDFRPAGGRFRPAAGSQGAKAD